MTITLGTDTIVSNSFFMLLLTHSLRCEDPSSSTAQPLVIVDSKGNAYPVVDSVSLPIGSASIRPKYSSAPDIDRAVAAHNRHSLSISQ